MKKKELKNAFEKEFEKISVSDELKAKTLNAVNTSKKQKTSHIPYIKNFAAVFVVTLLCLSIYFSNNTYKKQFETYDTAKGETIYESGINESNTTRTYGTPSLKSFNNEEIEKASLLNDTASLDYFSASNNNAIQEKAVITDYAKEDSIKALSEEDFLAQYPDAKKIENGYVIYEGKKESIYFFKNNTLENVIIID